MKEEWDLTFKQRIWLEWLKVNNPYFIQMISMEKMIDYVLMKDKYNKEQREKLNQMYDSYKKSNKKLDNEQS